MVDKLLVAGSNTVSFVTNLTHKSKRKLEEFDMKEFIAGLVLTLVIGGIGIAIEMQEREEVKYINADCN